MVALVNGDAVGTGHDDQSLPEGGIAIGVAADSKDRVEARFRNLVVTGIE